jgi:hypothetical protein
LALCASSFSLPFAQKCPEASSFILAEQTTDRIMPEEQSPVFIFISFSGLEFELRVHTLNRSISLFFVMFFFEIGSCQLFAQAVFKP